MVTARKILRPVLAAALCGVAGAGAAFGGQPLSITVTGTDNRPVAGVVVYLPDVRAPGVQPPVVIDQRDEEFVPAIAVVHVGSEVLFTNSDLTSHHVYSFSKPNAFELPLYKGNARLASRFDQPGVVVLGCNIHDSMLGYIVVVESTRSAVTGPDGRAVLADVPAGRHVVRAWAPGLDRSTHPEVGVAQVGDAAPAMAAVRVPVAGGVSPPEPAATKKRGSLAGSDY
jgi:plastocyanin